MRLKFLIQKSQKTVKALYALTAITATYACLVSNMAFADAASFIFEMIIGFFVLLFIVLGAIFGIIGAGEWMAAHGEGDGPAKNKAIGKVAAAIGLIVFAVALKGKSSELISVILSEI